MSASIDALLHLTDDTRQQLLKEPFTKAELALIVRCLDHCSTGTHRNVVPTKGAGRRLALKCHVKMEGYTE